MKLSYLQLLRAPLHLGTIYSLSLTLLKMIESQNKANFIIVMTTWLSVIENWKYWNR